MQFDKLKINQTKYIHYENNRRNKLSMPSQHYHDVFELYFLEEGECKYFIDDKTYDVKAGDLILIPKGIIHKTMYTSNQHVRRLINCSTHYIPTAIIERLNTILYHYRNESITQEIKDLLNNIEKEYQRKDEFSSEALKNYIHLLFYLLIRNTNQINKANFGTPYVTEAINYIKENFHTNISLTEIANNLSISFEHLSRLFKSETGFTFIKYLNMLRFQKAETLLKDDNDLSITEIAFACGFNDSNYFSNKFKQTYGISPLKYRKQN